MNLIKEQNNYFLLLSLYLVNVVGELKTLEIALTTIGRGDMPLLKSSKGLQLIKFVFMKFCITYSEEPIDVSDRRLSFVMNCGFLNIT